MTTGKTNFFNFSTFYYKKPDNINNMEFTEKIKEEFEGRIKNLENFIAEKGVGSKQLKKVRKTQRNVNLAIVVGSLITVAGITVWVVTNNRNHD
jgi:hypothetical protein